MNSNRITRSKTISTFFLVVLSILVGIVAGLGAVIFRGLIALFHNLLFFGKVSVIYDANIHTPASPWGPLVVLVPVVGAYGVAFLVKNFGPEAKGAGVPEVMDAIYYGRGKIRPIVAVIKSLASALSIGSGGSVGREGPVMQIGSSLASAISQVLKLPLWQTTALIAGGAGGGIAATFNTPIGGVLFVQEILMREISARTLVPVAIATVTAAYIGRLFFGTHPSFVIPALEIPQWHQTNLVVLLMFAGLGAITGVVSALFIKSIYGSGDFFDRCIGGSYYRKHLLGMFAVGIIMYLLMLTLGHYYIEGVGYSTVQNILASRDLSFSLLILLFAMKLLTTSLTLGSGASGGIFSPSLFMGATLGGAYGLLVSRLFPQLEINPAVFAIAGMAGLVGSATGAAIAAVVMIFEMTRDYNVIIPMTVVVAISFGIRKLLSAESIYTMKLSRRGHHIPTAMLASPRFVIRAGEIMFSEFGSVSVSNTLNDLAKIVTEKPSLPIFVVTDHNHVVGFLQSEDVVKALNSNEASTKLDKIAEKDFTAIDEQTVLPDVLAKMRSDKASIAIVSDSSMPIDIEKVKGVITKQQVAEVILEEVESLMD